ncbi:uncharacterized protein ACIBXB_004059 isoform 1-T2 [Morphnus guianensis]
MPGPRQWGTTRDSLPPDKFPTSHCFQGYFFFAVQVEAAKGSDPACFQSTWKPRTDEPTTRSWVQTPLRVFSLHRPGRQHLRALAPELSHARASTRCLCPREAASCWKCSGSGGQRREPAAVVQSKSHQMAAWSHLNEIRISARP